MNQFQYLLLMGACLAITLPLEVVLDARVYRRLRLLLPTLLVVVVVFGLWDLLGIARGHWTYSSEYMTGVALGPMPLEEIVFFVVIPLAALLSYEGVGTLLRRLRGRRHERDHVDENDRRAERDRAEQKGGAA
jgi:lycopene cyclase domain-containing protein